MLKYEIMMIIIIFFFVYLQVKKRKRALIWRRCLGMKWRQCTNLQASKATTDASEQAKMAIHPEKQTQWNLYRKATQEKKSSEMVFISRWLLIRRFDGERPFTEYDESKSLCGGGLKMAPHWERGKRNVLSGGFI